MTQQMKKVFALFDKDKDGKITEAEIRSAFKELGQAVPDAEVKTLMATLDLDGNGFVDEQEFILLNLRKAFAKFDRDGNGYISNTELFTALTDLGFSCSKQEVAEMIKGIDTDQDGKVNFAEFKKMMEKI